MDSPTLQQTLENLRSRVNNWGINAEAECLISAHDIQDFQSQAQQIGQQIKASTEPQSELLEEVESVQEQLERIAHEMETAIALCDYEGLEDLLAELESV